MAYPALLLLMCPPWLPVVDWTDAPADLNGLVPFAGTQNLVSARVPSHFKCSLTSLHNAVFIWKPCTWDDPNYNLQFSDQYLYRKCLALCMATHHFSDNEFGTHSSLNSGEYSVCRTGASVWSKQWTSQTQHIVWLFQ